MPLDSGYSLGIRRGVLSAVDRAGDWQVVELPYRPSGATPARSGLESLDGVVAWVDRRHKWLGELAGTGVPIVNCGGDWDSTDGVATIAVDMGSVLDMAIRHITDLGISRLWFFGHRVSQSDPRLAMMEAIRRRATPFGIGTGYLETGGRSPDEDLARLLAPDGERDLVAAFDGLPTGLALFCENDHFGRLACNMALRTGRAVPADLAVLGAGNGLIGRYGDPTISTVAFPGEEIGRRGFELVARAATGEPMPHSKVSVPADELIVRESTGGRARDVALERVHRRIEAEALGGLTFGELPHLAGISAKVLRERYREAYGEVMTRFHATKKALGVE